MKNRYILEFSKQCARDVKKYTRKDPKLKFEFRHKIKILASDPFSKSLNTHVVNISGIGRVYSSSINKDFRIVWVFLEEKIILLHRFGSHSGSSKVYR